LPLELSDGVLSEGKKLHPGVFFPTVNIAHSIFIAVFTLAGLLNDRRVINPSISSKGTQLRHLIVARRDYLVTRGMTWFGREYFQHRWETQVIMGTYDARRKYQSAILLNTDSVKPCMPPITCDTNGTLVQKISTGPEDPRLFEYNGAMYVSFFSYDAVPAPSQRSAADHLGDFGTGTRHCVPGRDGLIGRMYVAKIVDQHIHTCVLGDIMPVTPVGLAFPKYSIVKNWLAFAAGGHGAPRQLFFIHQISPFFVVMGVRVIRSSAIETAVASNTTTPEEIVAIDRAARRGSTPAFTLVQQDGLPMYLSPQQLAHQSAPNSTVKISSLDSGASVGETSVHGGANPVYISAADSILKTGYFLSIFHTISTDAALHYQHYAFAFCDSRPFRISALSSPLPLTTVPTSRSPGACGRAPFAFVSGLALTECSADPSAKCLLVSYGVCDVESRVAEVRLRDLELTFSHLHTC
jgi:hypothetical protein